MIIRIEDIKNNTILNINNYSIQIEKTDPPKIAKNQNEVYCIFEGKKTCNIKDKNNLFNIQDFKLYFINLQYHLEDDKSINNYCDGCFSAYLIYNNKIFDELKGIYNFIIPNEINDYYGFTEEKFSKSKMNDLKIILGCNNKKESVFTHEQREKFKSFIKKEEFLNKIESNDIKKISEAIGYLIEKNDLNLEENSLEKTIKNLEITNEKKNLFIIS